LISRETEGFLKSGDRYIEEFLTTQPFAMALVPKKSDGPAFLFAVRLPSGVRPASVHHFFRQHWSSYTEKKLLEISYYERVFPDGNVLYLVIRGGILLCSTDREVFELGYYTPGSGNHILKDESFCSVREQLMKSRNHTTRVYISNEGLFSWASRFIRDEKKSLIASIPDGGSWGGFELMLDGKQIQMQGFTETGESGKEFFNALTEAEVVLDDPGIALPVNTIFYHQIAIRSVKEYQNQYLDGYIKRRDGAGEAYPVSNQVIDSVITILDMYSPGSLVHAATQMSDTTEGSNYLLLLQVQDASGLILRLHPYADSTTTFRYQDFSISTINPPYLIPALFGNNFRLFQSALVTSWQDYLIIAPNQGAMLSVLNQIISGRKLSETASYEQIFAKVKGQMSRRIYFDRNEGDSYLKSILQEQKLELFNQFIPYFPNQMMISYAKSGGILLTDIVLQTREEGLVPAKGGEILLDAPVDGKPLIIRDYRVNERKVMVADESGCIYLLDQKGEMEWKFTATEPPASGMFSIDLYKNGRQQCLFFSRNMLHVVQIDGKYAPGFPVKIVNPFEAELSVFDYDQSGNFRFVYYDSNRHLSNIDVTGNIVAGWSMPAIKGLKKPVQYFKSGGQDFLVYIDSDGLVHFTDRRGRERFQIKQTAPVHPNSEVILMNKGSQQLFCWLDASSSLVQISTEGDRVKADAWEPHPNAWFLKTSGSDSKLEITLIDPETVLITDGNLKILKKVPLSMNELSDINACLYHPGLLVTGKDANNQPFVVLRPEMKVLNINANLDENFIPWRALQSSDAFYVTSKGKTVVISRL
jgi:hypothetical protein